MPPLFSLMSFPDSSCLDFGSGVFGSGVFDCQAHGRLFDSTVQHEAFRFSTGFSLVLV